MNINSPSSFAALCVVITFSISPVIADTIAWNPPDGGSGGSTSWNNPLNWDGGIVPTNDLITDTAVFSGSAYDFQPDLDVFTVQSVNGMLIGGLSAAAVTLSAGSGSKTNSVASTTGSSSLILSDVNDLVVGQHITGAGIGVGTFITDIDVGTNTITLSRNTTGNTGAAAELTINSSLRLGDGGITMAENTPTSNNTITAPIVLGANQEWAIEAQTANRTLNIQGSIYLDNFTLTLSGAAGTTFSFNGPQGGTAGLRQSIGGTGGIVIDTEGTVSFSAGSGNRMQNTFTGGVTLNNGLMTLQGGNAGGSDAGGHLGTGVLTINGGSISGGGNINGHPLTISGQVWNADWSFVGSRNLQMGDGAVTLNNDLGDSRTLTVEAGSNVLEIGGAIEDGTATSFVKEGSSALRLTGDSTFTGSTTVAEGTLIVNGSLSGGGNVSVNAGATLSGSGSIAGNTFISGTHAPGNSPGIQTFGADLTYIGDASAVFEFTQNSSVQDVTPIFDQVLVGGDLDFAGDVSLSLAFNAASSVDWTDSFWNSDQSWLLYEVAGTTTNFENFSLYIENWQDSQGAFFDTARSGSMFTLSQDGNDVYLNYVIPEPSAALLLLGSLALMVFRRRRAA